MNHFVHWCKSYENPFLSLTLSVSLLVGAIDRSDRMLPDQFGSVHDIKSSLVTHKLITIVTARFRFFLVILKNTYRQQLVGMVRKYTSKIMLAKEP